MLGGIFGRRKDRQNAVRMPEVDEPDDIGAVFATARRAASGEGEQPPVSPGRHVIIVTPGRMLKFQPCPPVGSMAAPKVASIEQMIPSNPKRNIAAIAFTEVEAIAKNADKAIPFLGILLGFAYIGHAVWVFEGHPSALAAGCREADVLLVDGAMVPWLQSEWAAVAAKAMRRPEIYVHDRATYSLRRVSPTASK
jgi:hypothetical protein